MPTTSWKQGKPHKFPIIVLNSDLRCEVRVGGDFCSLPSQKPPLWETGYCVASRNTSRMLRRIIAFWGDLSLCSRPHFAALRLLYLTLQATVQVAYLIINIIELQFSPCTFLLPIREIFIPFPGFSRYDVPFTNHFLSSFHCFFVGFPCFPLRKCIAIPLFHYATFCFRMSDLLNTSVSGDSSKTVRLVIIVCT